MGRAAARARARPKPAFRRHAPRAERWLSGRKHRTRNAAYGQPYRGFESHPLRHATGPLVSTKERCAKASTIGRFKGAEPLRAPTETRRLPANSANLREPVSASAML